MVHNYAIISLKWFSDVMFCFFLMSSLFLYIHTRKCHVTCGPGFGQDRGNFHWTAGRGTAGGWGLTPPGQTEPGIPYHVTSHWVPVGDGWRGGNSLAVWEGAAPVLFGKAAVWVVRFVVVFSPYLYRCCSCFPLFAVLLNCPYPDAPVSACFFSFSSACRWGEGRLCGAFVAGGSRNQNTLTHI